jgi:hypothetical protein
MHAVNYSDISNIVRAGEHVDSTTLQRTDSLAGRTPNSSGLADEIDRLRQIMAETFVRESSFTADTVIRISRQLDVKINEYMTKTVIGRKKAR